jgi:hypothetical protein
MYFLGGCDPITISCSSVEALGYTERRSWKEPNSAGEEPKVHTSALQDERPPIHTGLLAGQLGIASFRLLVARLVLIYAWTRPSNLPQKDFAMRGKPVSIMTLFGHQSCYSAVA